MIIVIIMATRVRSKMTSWKGRIMVVVIIHCSDISSYFRNDIFENGIKINCNSDRNCSSFGIHIISIHKTFKSAAHCHSLSHSPQSLSGRA